MLQSKILLVVYTVDYTNELSRLLETATRFIFFIFAGFSSRYSEKVLDVPLK